MIGDDSSDYRCSMSSAGFPVNKEELLDPRRVYVLLISERLLLE